MKMSMLVEWHQVLLEEYQNMLSPKTKLVAVTHISNSLGTINPVDKIIEAAHAVGAAARPA